jgi:hypothetical protein
MDVPELSGVTPIVRHFIQEDVGPDLAARIVDWIRSTPQG